MVAPTRVDLDVNATSSAVDGLLSFYRRQFAMVLMFVVGVVKKKEIRYNFLRPTWISTVSYVDIRQFILSLEFDATVLATRKNNEGVIIIVPSDHDEIIPSRDIKEFWPQQFIAIIRYSEHLVLFSIGSTKGRSSVVVALWRAGGTT